MRHRFAGVALAWAIAALGIPSLVQAQGLTGQIAGIVTDTTGGVLPGVTVAIKNVGTGLTRETVTGTDGTFAFPDLLAGTFDLTVTMQGFKTYEQKGIELASTDRLRLRAIALDVGGLTETVSVQADAVQVQTTNGARSGLITRENLEDIALKGRDFAGMLKVLPGVIDTRNREAPGWESMNNLSINGRTSFNFSYDGVTNKDTGQNAGNFAAPALDSIAEVRVQTSNFQAEYGRSSGATISVVTRSGTRDFHGSAAFYKRDDALNGNEDLAPHPLSDTAGAVRSAALHVRQHGVDARRTRAHPEELLQPQSQQAVLLLVAGPPRADGSWEPEPAARADGARAEWGLLANVRQPEPPGVHPRFPADGKLRRHERRSRLLSQQRDPGRSDRPERASAAESVPDAERDRSDRCEPVQLRVPDRAGLAAQRSGASHGLEHHAEHHCLRAAAVRLRTTLRRRLAAGSNGGWPQMPTKYEIDTVSYVNTLLHTFNQTLYGEFTVGVNWAHQYTSPFDDAARDANDRRVVLPGMPQFFPEANPLHIIPQATFAGGVPGNPLQFNIEQRFGFFGYNTLFNVSGNVTKLKGAHTLKTGLFVEHTTRPAARTSSFNGAFSFNTDNQNQRNTNIGFANALIGAITEYTESDGHPSAHGQFLITEWYAQDNWRVNRNLTLDAGVRFYYQTPTQSEGDQVAAFEPGEWNSAQAPQLYQPVATADGRRARNPLTGAILPAVYIGRLVPGSGNFINGMHVYDGTPHDTSPFRVAPRFGFAWDVTGDGKTAVRGGAGVFYDRYSDDNILELIEMPPVLNTYRTNYTTISELLATPLSATPAGVRRIDPFTPPVVYNWSLGVQRDVGFNLIADAAYVGNAGRNQQVQVDLNGRPYGYAYLPSSLDPTTVVGGQAQPLPDDFLRPYQGFGRIQQREFTGYSDYHALQLSVNRRRSSDGLSVGAAYTYQISNQNLGAIDPFVDDNRARNYTSAGRRPHVLVINYSYDVPNLSQKWNNVVAKVVFDNWQFSGLTTFTSGTYGGFNFNYANLPTGVLSGNGSINGGGSRVVVTCDPNLPRGERTFERQFRTECVAPPTDQYRIGTALNDEYLGPGFMNWDISAFKHVPMGGARRLQLRVELYNAFNTDQWTGVNNNASFDYTTGALTNANTFGRLNGNTNSARRIQLGARFLF